MSAQNLSRRNTRVHFDDEVEHDSAVTTAIPNEGPVHLRNQAWTTAYRTPHQSPLIPQYSQEEYMSPLDSYFQPDDREVIFRPSIERRAGDSMGGHFHHPQIPQEAHVAVIDHVVPSFVHNSKPRAGRRNNREPNHSLPYPAVEDEASHKESRRRSQESDDTLYEDEFKSDKPESSPSSPAVLPTAYPRRGRVAENPATNDIYTAVPRPLRSALRRAETQVAAPLSRASTNGLEEGARRPSRGVFASLLHLYGHSGSPRRALSTDSASTRPGHSRANSQVSVLGGLRRRRQDSVAAGNLWGDTAPLDPDDPRVTGVKPNRLDDERHAKETVWERLGSTNRSEKRARKASIVYHVSSILQRQHFILKLAKTLMTFGAPSHRIESQLIATARVLEIEAQFVHLPSIIIASFGDTETKTSDTHFVKAHGSLALGALHTVHNIYRQVVHDEIGVEAGTNALNGLLKQPPIYGLKTRCLIAYLCAALICPLAFGGSFLDMVVSGACGAVLAFLQLHAANKNAMYANVFEISIAILMSFVARALSSIPSKLFCYEAVSSAAVVLILPGYLILCSSLELASKNIVCGSVRMIYAIIYSLFLGFGLTIGSDLYFLVDRGARERQDLATRELEAILVVHGTFIADNSTELPAFMGSFSFKNSTMTSPHEKFLDGSDLCFRDPNGPWYTRSFPPWTLFILVPLFSIFSSFWNLQPLKSKQLVVMVIISCAAFAANKLANNYIFNRSDVVSAIGAFVVGILGNLYSRVFRGTAFQSMVVGVLFLVPSGIAAAGGLAQNYRGSDDDEYSTGLTIGFRMIQVAIGITVGLFGSGLIVYSFGSKKNAALFAF